MFSIKDKVTLISGGAAYGDTKGQYKQRVSRLSSGYTRATPLRGWINY